MPDNADSQLQSSNCDERPPASVCSNCEAPATIMVGGPLLGPAVLVCDSHAGILKPLVADSLARLNRGMPWPEPKGVIRLNVDPVSY
jgi:hypothetical protein